jgi:hypothetical protein
MAYWLDLDQVKLLINGKKCRKFKSLLFKLIMDKWSMYVYKDLIIRNCDTLRFSRILKIDTWPDNRIGCWKQLSSPDINRMQPSICNNQKRMLHVSIINLNSNDLNFLHFLPCFDNFSFNENVDIKFSTHMTFLVYVHH